MSKTASVRIKREIQEYYKARTNKKFDYDSNIKDLNQNTIKKAVQNTLDNKNNETDFGYWLLFDENDIFKFQILIRGVPDTPYEGGYFHFKGEIPEEYPFKPPKITFLTTGTDKMRNGLRLHPNLKSGGSVCLSILGTYIGPGWNSSMSIDSVCISIRSLLCENPYTNEPGFEKTDPQSKSAIG